MSLAVVCDGQARPTEGLEVIRPIGQDRWYIHGSMIAITRAELIALQVRYPSR